MHLYIRNQLSLSDTASQISCFALNSFSHERRDGLNLGRGEYIRFSKDQTEILLVCNDAEHAEVFVEFRSEFPY
jgi:hypothetical protein